VTTDDVPPSSAPDSELPPGSPSIFSPQAAVGRLLIALAGGAAATLLSPGGLPWRVRAVLGWDTGALLFVLLTWTMIARATPAATRQRAALEDPGRRLVFFIALASSAFSLFAAVVVIREVRELAAGVAQMWTALALAAVALSWIVTHTAFTLRYAHLYYRRRGDTKCLQFPGTTSPCDLDFAYFAFTIGMCFQVSDVVIASSGARRVVLLHALVSFVYNTTILALSLNLVTTLLG
jgi:uncharacterized membrane protein